MSVLRAVARRALAARAGVRAPVASSAPVAVLRVTRSQSSLAAGAEGEELDHAPEAEVAFDESLPVYMTTLTFSEKGVQAMLNRDIDREKVRVGARARSPSASLRCRPRPSHARAI